MYVMVPVLLLTNAVPSPGLVTMTTEEGMSMSSVGVGVIGQNVDHNWRVHRRRGKVVVSDRRLRGDLDRHGRDVRGQTEVSDTA